MHRKRTLKQTRAPWTGFDALMTVPVTRPVTGVRRKSCVTFAEEIVKTFGTVIVRYPNVET